MKSAGIFKLVLPGHLELRELVIEGPWSRKPDWWLSLANSWQQRIVLV